MEKDGNFVKKFRAMKNFCESIETKCKYAVVGSMCLETLGIHVGRDIDDIDIVVYVNDENADNIRLTLAMLQAQCGIADTNYASGELVYRFLWLDVKMNVFVKNEKCMPDVILKFNGMNFAQANITLAEKVRMCREKDIKDLDRIAKQFLIS